MGFFLIPTINYSLRLSSSFFHKTDTEHVKCPPRSWLRTEQTSEGIYAEALRHFSGSDQKVIAKRMDKTLKERVASKNSWLSIALIGDSVTRYQYLSLVTYAHGGSYVRDDTRPNPMMEKTFRSWKEFYEYTNKQLQPQELCDCNRPQKWDLGSVYENRYYFDEEARVSITYIQAFGDGNIHGHFEAESVHTGSLHMRDVYAPHSRRVLPPKWTFNWEGVFGYVARIRPKPTHVVLNEGLWENSFGEAEFREKVVAAAKREGFVVVWKTTNFKKKRWQKRKVVEADTAMCELADMCLNLNWTCDVDTKYYWDDNHYFPVIYHAINEHMLSLLGY